MKRIVTLPYEGGGVRVELNPCRHCKAVPTEEDAAKAVAHERETTKACAVCGGKPKLYPQYGLYHSVDEEQDRRGWLLCGSGTFHDPTWDPEWVTTYCTGPSGTVEGAFHVACLKKVAPGVVIHKR